MKSFYYVFTTVILIVFTSIFFYFNTNNQLNKNVCQDSILNKHNDLALNPYNDFIFSILHDDTIKIKELLDKKLVSIDSAVKYSADEELKINNYSWTGIGVACRKGNLKMIKFLVKNNADIHEGYYDEWFGYTSMFAAVESKNIDVVNYLISKKVAVDIGAAENGFSPLIVAIQDNSFEMCKLLLENGANPNKDETAFPDIEPWIPLKTAIEKNNIKIVNLLLQFGADKFTIHGEENDTIFKK